MAKDKAVDSTQLDSDLTSVANAIRARSGGSGQLAFPAGFVSEIGNIPSGGGGPQYIYTKNLYTVPRIRPTQNVATEEISLDLSETNSDVTNLQNLFCPNSGWYSFKKITLKVPDRAFTCTTMFYNSASGKNVTEEVTIIGTLKVENTSASQGGAFAGLYNCVDFNGTVDLTAVTTGDHYSKTNSTNHFYLMQKVKKIDLVPGCMRATTSNWTLQWLAELTDDGLVSIANSLQDTYSGTITFHATPKARLSTIMGTVATAGGLSTFTKDANGTVSLENFLTVTKGATLA